VTSLFIFVLFFWWRQLAAGGSLNCDCCWGCWGERSRPRSVTAIHSLALDRTPNLPIGRRTLYHKAIAAPRLLWQVHCAVKIFNDPITFPCCDIDFLKLVVWLQPMSSRSFGRFPLTYLPVPIGLRYIVLAVSKLILGVRC